MSNEPITTAKRAELRRMSGDWHNVRYDYSDYCVSHGDVEDEKALEDMEAALKALSALRDAGLCDRKAFAEKCHDKLIELAEDSRHREEMALRTAATAIRALGDE